MNATVIDALLTAMVQSGTGVSDLLFAVGKPPIVEDHGALEEFPIDTPGGVLGMEQIEQIAAHLMQDNSRLVQDLAEFGSCDGSYALGEIARFRVNIFKQNGRQAIVMRQLATKIPTLEDLSLPPIFQADREREERHHLRDWRHRERQDDHPGGDAERTESDPADPHHHA